MIRCPFLQFGGKFEPQATKKFFGAAVFQKCCRGVGEQPTFAEQIVFRSLFFLLAGKSRGGTPFCRMRKIGFPKSEISNYKPQANKKFFDPTIFQKCWRGSGRVALIAARRQRNLRAMLLAHGGGGEKSDSFSRRGEQDRPALFF